MYAEDFIKRLTELRLKRGVSARDMSLSLGQNSGYINNIESGKALPSMTVFFYICEYLNITPQEFFEIENQRPNELKHLTEYLILLNDEQFTHISAIVKDLVKK